MTKRNPQHSHAIQGEYIFGQNSLKAPAGVKARNATKGDQKANLAAVLGLKLCRKAVLLNIDIAVCIQCMKRFYVNFNDSMRSLKLQMLQELFPTLWRKMGLAIDRLPHRFGAL